MSSMLSAMFAKFSSGLTVGKSASKDLFDFMACFQPLAEKDAKGEAERTKAFRGADPNGNGLCSLAELETWILGVLLAKYPKTKKDGPERGRDLWELFRPSYIRAFADAKDYKHNDGEVIEGTKNANADDFVSKGEFRLFNAYLCVYASMYDAFAKIDGGGEGRDGDDRKIDLGEWMAGYKGVKEHGFIALSSVKDDKSADAIFKKIDGNGGGVIMLEEWCDFLKAAEIEAGTTLGKTLAEDESAEESAAKKGGKGGAAAAKGGKAKGGGGGGGGAAAAPGKALSSGLKVGKGASQELYKFIDVFQPLAEKGQDAKLKEAFVLADPNGNGLCSLAELETYVLKKLVAKFPKTGKGKDMKEPGKDIWDAFRPCYIRAFKDAADYARDDGATIAGTKGAKQDDFVNFAEFRLFNAYACIYAAMFDAFSKIDGGGAGRDAKDDRRMDKDEWMKGWKGVQNYGFVALDSVKDKKSAEEVFGKIDDNGGGIVLLDEWCEFIKAAEIAAGTELGKTLAEDEEGGVGKKWEKPAGKKDAMKPGAKRPSAAAGAKKPSSAAGGAAAKRPSKK